MSLEYQKPETELFIASNKGPPLKFNSRESGQYMVFSIYYYVTSRTSCILGKELTTDERAESAQYDITEI